MEDLDGLIMGTLEKLNCSFCNEVDSLSLLGLNDIIEATVRLLWACDPANVDEIPSFKLPEQMTTRYKAATKIAKAIKQLGIREEVGYQTLLYPNVYEIRQIFISLIEKLPKAAVIANNNKSPLERLRAEVGEQIRSDLAAPRYPCYCRFLLRSKQPNKWHLKAHHAERCGFTTSEQKPTDFRHRICAALEDAEAAAAFDPAELTWTSTRTSASSSFTSRVSKPAIPSKPRLPPKPKARRTGEAAEKAESEEQSDEKTEIERALAENHELKLRLAERAEELDHLYDQLNSTSGEIEATRTELEKHDEKLLQILRNPDEQLPALRSFVDQSAGRRRELEEKFNEWTAANLPRLEELRQQRGVVVTDVVQTEIDETAAQLRRVIAQQTHALHKLQKQANREEPTTADHSERAKFLSRILYLVKNINGQKREIERNFKECKKLEKERTHLNGVLDRSFTVVSNYLTTSTEQKMICNLAHNQLIKMHSQRESIIRTWEEMLRLNQQADELQDQIDVLKQQSVDASLSQVLNDLERVRAENAEIRGRLERKRAAH